MSEKTSITTKERILDAAEGLMLEKSFHSVGLNEILAAVNVPKGSFYHHFGSKEQFGIELLRHYMAQAYEHKQTWLQDRSQFPDALERMIRYLEAGMAKFLENGCRPICLVVKLCGEVATFSDGMREELAGGFKKWDKLAEDTIREGQSQGSIRKELDVSATVMVLSSVWVGAMLRAQVLKNVSPMKQAIAFMREVLSAKSAKNRPV
jgi:TetR/AcrR family transcriptional regulator, transcriptional repressor for nem operon